MTRDALVLGPDRLVLKTTIALYHRGISLNSYSIRDSQSLSYLNSMFKKKKKKISEAEALQSLFFKKATEQGSSFRI